MEQLDYQDIQAFDVQVKYRRLPLHRHNVHEFFYCYEGAGDQLVERGIEPMRPGDLYFFPSGDPHRGSGAPEVDCGGAVINFGDDLLAGLPRDGEDLTALLKLLRRWAETRHHRVPLTPQGSLRVGDVFRAMVRENREQRPGCRAAMLILAQQLLLTILRHSAFPTDWQAQSRPDPGAKIAYVCLYLERNCTRPIRVEEVCAAADMSRSRFHAAFLRHTGMTMTAYLAQLRVRMAVKMLRENRLTTPEIVRYCGFGSPAAFYRALRHEIGRRPEELRGLQG